MTIIPVRQLGKGEEEGLWSRDLVSPGVPQTSQHQKGSRKESHEEEEERELCSEVGRRRLSKVSGRAHGPMTEAVITNKQETGPLP